MTERIAIRDIGHLPQPGMDAPAGFAFSPDGGGLTFLHAADGGLVRALWYRDLASGETQPLLVPDAAASDETRLSHEERLQRERSRASALGVTDYAWARDATTLVARMAGGVMVGSSDHWPGPMRALGVEAAQAAIPSPDGRWLAVMSAGDIWLHPLDGGSPRRITDDAEAGVFSGLPEYIAAEELGRSEGLWWSRDSRHVAFARVDERAIPPFSIGHLGAPQPRMELHRYPFAGGPNATVELRVMELASATAHPVDLGMSEGDYLARVLSPAPDGWLVAVLPRDQRSLRWLRVMPDGAAAELWRESTEPWVNLDLATAILDDGRIVRGSEEGSKAGHRHLVVREPDGSSPRRLTDGPWDVTQINAVDPERGALLFTATRGGVTERHLYRVPLGATEPVRDPERLTIEPGWHEVVADARGRQWVDTWSSRHASPSVRLHGPGGGDATVLHAATMQAAPASARGASRSPRAPELLELRAGDGQTTIHAAVYEPEHPAAVPPPCVVWTYGGPNKQVVTDSWDLTIHPLRRYLVAAGVSVLMTDGRGSANRGLAFEAALDHDMGAAEIDDQAAAVRQLAELGRIDPRRVAITGASYGGFATIMAMLRHPDLFRTGVAVAPVTAWDGYDTAYTERYLGMPDHEDGAAYTQSSVLPRAAELRGELLLIHGAIDENVHLRHSLRLVAALQAAAIDVELVILPDDRHRVRTAAGLLTRDRRTVRHLLRGLGLEAPEGQAAS